MSEAPATPTAQIPEADALKDSYSNAQKKLREENLERFNTLRKEAMAELGYPDWSPKPTKAEKAAAEIEKLLADNPELREKFGQVAEDTEAAATPAVKAVPKQRG